MHHQHRHLPRDVVERAPIPALTTVNGQVMSVVYVTQLPTFTGVIGGFSTLGDGDSSTAQSAQPTGVNSQSSDDIAATSSAFQAQPSASSQSVQSNLNSFTSAIVASSTGLAATSLIAPSSARHSASYTNTAIAGASTTGASSSDSSSSSSSSGMSMGAKTGLAVGIICAIGVIATILLLLLARKRKQQQVQEAKAEAEKSNQNRAPPARLNDPEAANAPQLSLRPVSKLAPEFMGGNTPKNRMSQGNTLMTIGEKDTANSHRALMTENPFKDPENPFADPEKAAARTAVNDIQLAPMAESRVAAAQPLAKELRSPTGPRAESFPLPQPQSQPTNPTQDVKTIPAVAPISVPRGARATNVELAAPSPVVAQGPGPEMPGGSVYRILMDFKPNMEDELELRAGQLVRVLHEYDDGWALCIRLDRSQQGVVPRTCLAAKPSKPRPGPPPPGNAPNQPAPRPITPQGRPRGPLGPVVGSPRGQGQPPSRTQSPVPPTRTQSPGPVASPVARNTGSFNQPPRPLSPGPRPPKQRSMSPGPYGAGGPKPMAPAQQRRRSNSAGAASVRNKRSSPPGPSKLGPGLSPVDPDSPGLAI